MATKRLLQLGLMTILFGAGYVLGGAKTGALVSEAVASPIPVVQANMVYELRTYTANPEKLDDLLARFRDHTLRIFENHGMTNVGYWVYQDEPLSENTLTYLLAHDSREAAQESWRRFGGDPEWQTVARESQVDGRLISGLTSVFLDPTDFSPMR